MQFRSDDLAFGSRGLGLWLLVTLLGRMAVVLALGRVIIACGVQTCPVSVQYRGNTNRYPLKILRRTLNPKP